jgi:hypothetical protein
MFRRFGCRLLGHDYRFLTPTHSRHCDRRCGLPGECACRDLNWGGR